MADEFRTFAVTIPAGTAQGSPQITALAIPIDRLASRIQIVVPGGCNGQVGFAFANAHQQVIPYGAGQWIITDRELIDWAIGDVLNDADWSIIAYNTGSFAHTLQIRFLLELAAKAKPLPLAPLGGTALTGTITRGG